MPLPFLSAGTASSVWPVSNLAGTSNILSQGSGTRVPFSANFISGVYVIDGAPSTLAAATDYVRAGTAYSDNVAGTWLPFGTNVERITDKGIRIEPAATNGVRNPDMAGADPSMEWFPQYWSTYVGGGLTLTVEATGSAIGFTYLRFRLQGVASSDNGMLIFFEEANQIAAVQWQYWMLSCFIRVAAGSLTGINFTRFNTWENNAGGSNINIGYGPDFKATLDSAWRRFTSPIQLSQATTAFVQPVLELSYSNGAVVDVQIDLVMPQIELGQIATSPVIGARAADALQLNLPPGNHGLVYTFYDTTTQAFLAVPGGAYAVDPTTLAGPLVARIDWGSV